MSTGGGNDTLMKRITAYLITGLVLGLLTATPLPAQSARSYVIGFYNLENLFDT